MSRGQQVTAEAPPREADLALSPARMGSAGAVVMAVSASFLILLDLAFSGRVFKINAELVATVAILGASGAVYAWLEARRRIEALRHAELELAHARDQAEQANRAKSMFLATMSHEIRTPMNGVLGMLRLVADTGLTEEQRAYVGTARQSGEALLQLIDEILDFSRIEAGHVELRHAPVDLLRVVEEVTELLAPRAHAKAISIACYVDPALGPGHWGDEARLRQILLNLAGNALKFTEAGGVMIELRRDRSDPVGPGEGVLIRVADTGIGMRQDELDTIFEEFSQADSTTTRRFGGTGLGLAITRRLVDRMGGTIRVASTPGEGSVFEVALALEAAAGPPARGPARVLAGLRIAAAGLDRVTAGALRSYLRDYGATLVAPADGTPDAVAAVCGADADVAVIDATGRIDAAMAAAQAASALPSHPRLVVLLAPEDRRYLGDLRDAGFDAYLIKPLRRASLLERLSALGAPGDAPQPALMEAEPEAAPAPVRAGPPLKVLLAEDNEVNALLVSALLYRDHHKVTHVTDGAAALAAVCEQAADAPFDAILMDIQMPDLDGIEAARRIRAFEAEAGLARVPIVALTANSFDEDRDACLAAGMDEHLAKPVDPDRLAALLAELTGEA